MRPAAVLVAALALAACQVDVEGAPCATPGTTTDCPDGQACGNDLKCSERAAGCVASGAFCTPTGSAATSPKRCRDNPASVETCTRADAVCGAWAVVESGDYCPQYLVCGTPAGMPTCVCAPPAGEISVDPASSSSTLAPTGAAQPPECRFKKLGDALAAAAARGGPIAVKALGTAGSPVVFANETFPLEVPPGVTLEGADAPAGETIVEGDAATSATMVALQGTLQGIHLANVSMIGNGVDMTCGATGAPTLRDVTVSAGAQPLARGITVAGDCGALLERVDVSGASGPALDIAATAATAPITVTGGKFHLSGKGIQATGGTLVLQPDATAGATEVTDNAGTGIRLTGATPAVDATLTGVLVARNGGTGILVDNVAQASSLRMTSCDVQANGTLSPAMYGPVGSRRSAGGMLLSQFALATFQLRGNTFHADYGAVGADELAFESSGSWMLSTGSCASPAPNAFGCLKAGSLAVSVTSPGTIDAQFTTWPVTPPPAVSGVDPTNYCGAWTGTCPP